MPLLSKESKNSFVSPLSQGFDSAFSLNVLEVSVHVCTAHMCGKAGGGAGAEGREQGTAAIFSDIKKVLEFYTLYLSL